MIDIYVSKYISEIYNLKYKVEIFTNDTTRYRNN